MNSHRPNHQDDEQTLAPLIDRTYTFTARGWLVVTAALVVVGLLNLFVSMPGRSGPFGEGPQAEVAASPGAVGGLSGDEFDDLPNVHYAGIDLVVTDVRGVPQTASGDSFVVVDLIVANGTDRQRRLSENMFQLLADDGRSLGLDRFEYAEHSTRLSLAPGEAVSTLAVFRIPGGADPDPSRFRLQIAESGRWPATLPLVGPAESTGFPSPLAGEGRISDLPDGSGLSLISAETVLDHRSFRAGLGRHLAVITIEVEGEQVGGAEVLRREYWALDDGEPRRSLLIEDLERSAERTIVRLVFDYRTEASDLTLLADPSGTGGPHEIASFAVQPFE